MTKSRKILITGSQGYIGSSLNKVLFNKYNLINLDKSISPLKLKQKNFFKINILNYNKLNSLFKKFKIDLIIHLAGESTIDNISKKRNYINNNIKATENLIKLMKKFKVRNLIFSSSAAVYGKKNRIIKESSPKIPNNIYGKTKLITEKIIIKESKSQNFNYIILRFFNVCSSIREKKIGEFHINETHLIPLCVNKFLNNKTLKIYGKNFKTNDGTSVRDYIHIKDICTAVEQCIQYLFKKNQSQIFNLGTGKGFSNLEIANSFKSKNKFLKYIFIKNRKGDVDKLLCSYDKIKKIIGWKPRYSKLKKIIRDEIFWQKHTLKLNKQRTFRY